MLKLVRVEFSATWHQKNLNPTHSATPAPEKEHIFFPPVPPGIFLQLPKEGFSQPPVVRAFTSWGFQVCTQIPPAGSFPLPLTLTLTLEQSGLPTGQAWN